MQRNSPSRSVLITLLGNLAAPAASFITAPILAHALGVTGRGEVAAATAPLMFAVAAFTLGLPDALTLVVARRARRAGRAVVAVAACLAITGAVVVASFSVLAGPLSGGNDSIATLMRLATLGVIPGLILAAIRGVAYGFGAWGLVAAERSLSSIAKLFWLIGLSVAGTLDIYSAVLVLVVTSFGGVVAYIPLAFPRWRVRLRRAMTVSEGMAFASIVSFGLRNWIGGIAGIVLARFDQLVMSALSSPYDLGIYVVAVSIAELVLVLNSSVREVMFGMESRSPDVDRLARAARQSTLITALVGLAILGIGPWGIPLLFGDEFRGAYVPTAILVVGAVLGNPGSVAGAGLTARERPGLRSTSLLVACVVNVTVLVLLAPAIGAIGAAVATALGSIVAGHLNVYWLRRYFDARFVDFVVLTRRDAFELCSRVSELWSSILKMGRAR